MNESANGLKQVNRPKSAVVKTSIGFRPTRSESGPAAMAPMAAPNKPAENAGWKAAGDMANCSRINGPAKLMATLSTASSTATRPQKTNTRFWRADTGRSSISLSASICMERRILSPPGRRTD